MVYIGFQLRMFSLAFMASCSEAIFIIQQSAAFLLFYHVGRVWLMTTFAKFPKAHAVYSRVQEPASLSYT